MRRALGLLLAGALALGAAAEPFRDGDRVCFFGDSITHGGGWHRAIALYYLTRFPDRAVTFINSGSGGDNASNARKVRLGPDVVARRPTVVSVMFGMNDFGFRDYGANATPKMVAAQAKSLADYERNMADLVSDLRERVPGVRLYLMTPTPFDDAALYGKPVNEHLGANGGLVQAADAVARLAERTGATLVDESAAINGFYRKVRETDDAATFASDRIHPNVSTHVMMAVRFLEAQNAPRVVSDVKLQDGRVVGARNASVSDIAWGADKVSFTLLEKALPWPLDREVSVAKELVRAAVASFDQEVLAVYGLADGTWALTIDGQEVVSATARQWTVGVDLGANEKTPQYRQALDVYRANCRAHNRLGQVQATNVSIIRHVSREMRRQGLDPANAAARERYVSERLPKLNPWDVKPWKNALAEWDDNERLVSEMDGEWPKLRALATPRPHRYELTRRP